MQQKSKKRKRISKPLSKPLFKVVKNGSIKPDPRVYAFFRVSGTTIIFRRIEKPTV